MRISIYTYFKHNNMGWAYLKNVYFHLLTEWVLSSMVISSILFFPNQLNYSIFENV